MCRSCCTCGPRVFSVGPVGGAVARLVDLALLLQAAARAPLAGTLSLLSQVVVVVQQLLLLLVGQDVEEGGRGVASSGPSRVQGPRAPQS